MLNAKGKKILKSSYSVLQDDFFNFMRNAGYTDVEDVYKRQEHRRRTKERPTVFPDFLEAPQRYYEYKACRSAGLTGNLVPL